MDTRQAVRLWATIYPIGTEAVKCVGKVVGKVAPP